MRNGAEGTVLGIMCDADAAAAAHAAGEGAEITIDLGGKSGPEGVEPFSRTFRVARLGEGRFTTTGPCVGGRDTYLGAMALLTVGGVSVVVSTKRMQAYDQAPFRHVGSRTERAENPGIEKHRAFSRRLPAHGGRGPRGVGAGRPYRR